MKSNSSPIPLTIRREATARWSVIALIVLAIAGSGCVSNTYLSVRKIPENPLAGPLQLLSRRGPKPTPRTEQLLRRYDLLEAQDDEPLVVLSSIQNELSTEPDTEKMYAFAELAYIQGKRAAAKDKEDLAMHMYASAVAHCYLYLFAPTFDRTRNAYDPQFRQVCDLYNSALEDVLRMLKKQGKLQPGETITIESPNRQINVQVALRGAWRPDEIESFEFVSDYEVKGLMNVYRTYGLGVPLIAVRKGQEGRDPAAEFYPQAMSFPVTAILRAAKMPTDAEGSSCVTCGLELYDPLAGNHVRVANRVVPLQTDLTTPLGYYLDNPEFQGSEVATWGLLNPNSTSHLRGLYMLEAFDPDKIPVLMVHGLWSSPETWTEMFNDLRSQPEIRDRYQFWTYMYPTGQPFWMSAAQMRSDLENVRQAVDPQRRHKPLDEMVVVGHSMGGLVSRLQVLESGDSYWRLISDKPFDELNADEETLADLRRALFFEPSRSIRRVVTIGTPHRGSEFANDYTRWLGRKLITLPKMVVQTTSKLRRDNPDFFRDPEMLAINTSIDSLAADSPFLPVMLNSKQAPWVKHHNIVGVISKKDFLGRISKKGDGVVDYDSAHMESAASEIIVEADHVHVHQHPRAILEVRRILLEHSADMFAESRQRRTMQAGYNTDFVTPSHLPMLPEAPLKLPPPPSDSRSFPARNSPANGPHRPQDVPRQAFPTEQPPLPPPFPPPIPQPNSGPVSLNVGDA